MPKSQADRRQVEHSGLSPNYFVGVIMPVQSEHFSTLDARRERDDKRFHLCCPDLNCNSASYWHCCGKRLIAYGSPQTYSWKRLLNFQHTSLLHWFIQACPPTHTMSRLR